VKAECVNRTDITIAGSKRAFMAPPNCGDENMREKFRSYAGTSGLVKLLQLRLA